MNWLSLIFLFVCAHLLQCSSAFDFSDFEFHDIHSRFKRQDKRFLGYPGMGYPGGRPYPGGWPGGGYPGGRPYPGGWPGSGYPGGRPYPG
ncbi:hypothetical protein ANCDUO_23728, partial [Ancylostoma duodenale]